MKRKAALRIIGYAGSVALAVGVYAFVVYLHTPDQEPTFLHVGLWICGAVMVLIGAIPGPNGLMLFSGFLATGIGLTTGGFKTGDASVVAWGFGVTALALIVAFLLWSIGRDDKREAAASETP